MNKEKLIEVSNSLKFDANEKVANELNKEFSFLESQIIRMQKVNTENVEPMVRIDETPISFMREDIAIEGLPKEIILKNAPNNDNDFVIINKGEKNEK